MSFEATYIHGKLNLAKYLGMSRPYLDKLLSKNRYLRDCQVGKTGRSPVFSKTKIERYENLIFNKKINDDGI